MIPKVIHYIWLGGNKLPKIAEKCINSWKKHCPDYEIKRWDETNLNVNQYQFTIDAYKAKKFAFVSDVFRTEILYNEGGIYFDIDVELIKPIDKVLENFDCVMGFESSNMLAPGLLMASEKGNEDLLNILNIYKNKTFDIDNLKNITVCEIFTKYYEGKGLLRENRTQNIENTIFYSSKYFSPIDIITNKKKITKDTYSIHWYSASWYTTKQKIVNKLKKILNFITFGLAGKLYLHLKKNKPKNKNI